MSESAGNVWPDQSVGKRLIFCLSTLSVNRRNNCFWWNRPPLALSYELF